MFTGSYFTTSYFPPGYWPKTGSRFLPGTAVGVGLSRRLVEMAMAESLRRDDARRARLWRARAAAARLSFEMAQVRLRELEAEALRELQLQRAVAAAVLSEV